MNSAALNSFAINGAPVDAVVRSAVLANVVAQITAHPRVWARGLLDQAFEVAASTSFAGKVFRRSLVSVANEASLFFGIKNYTTQPTAYTVRADIVAGGEAVERELISNPLTWANSLLVTVSGSVVARSPVSAAPQASIVANDSTRIAVYAPVAFGAQAAVAVGGYSFANVRDTTNLVVRALVNVDPDIARQIPYDEDTVDERTIIVGREDRLLYVS